MKQGNQIDLRTAAGQKTVTLNPGGSVVFTINAQQSRIGAGGGGAGLYNYVRGIILSARVSITRATGGVTPVWADTFPLAIKSINLNSPMFGTLIDPTVMSGQVAKHLHEFVGMGYYPAGLNRMPVPGLDATYPNTDFEIYLPFCQRWNPWPDHFCKWLGWLDDSQLEIIVESAANPFLINAGITINSVILTATLDCVPWSEVIIPPEVTLRKYEQSASASSTGPTLTNVGTAGALQGVEDASRLVGMYFSHQVGGFQGSGPANQVQAITMTWRDQAQTIRPDMFFARWLNATHMRPKMAFATSGGNVISDGEDTAEPYQLPNGVIAGDPLNSRNAYYTPLIFSPRDALISQLMKVKGNYPIDMLFTAPQTNIFRVYTHELKQFSTDKCSEMIAAMGVDPTKVVMVPKMARKNFKKVDASKLWGFPRSLQAKVSTPPKR